MKRPLTTQADYPTTDGLCPDSYSLGIISPAYASSTGELNSVLQYLFHYFNFDKEGYREYADTLMDIAMAEMRHIELLGKTILALGAQPVYCQNPLTSFNFYSTKFINYTRNLVNMIEDDIISERRAIAFYSKMLRRLCNENVKAIIARILEDEKLHLEKLNEILKGLKC